MNKKRNVHCINISFVSFSVTTEPIGKAEAGMSSAVIIYIVVAILIAFLVIVDITCFFVGKMGKNFKNVIEYVIIII